MRSSLLLASVAILTTAIAAPASAALLAGNTDGTFTDIDNYNSNSGTPSGVAITNAGNGVKWHDPTVKTCQGGISWLGCLGGTYVLTDPFSTLDYADTAFSKEIAPGTDMVQIGSLTWKNAVNGGNTNNFDADFSIEFTITSPSAVAFTHILDLHVNNTTNPTGDQILSLTTPGNTPLDLGDGLTITNFAWELIGNIGSFTNGKWKNNENKTSVLGLFAYVSQAEAPVTVPEPAALALFGLGLAGLGLARRRRG